jgi:hypothetical protein
MVNIAIFVFERLLWSYLVALYISIKTHFHYVVYWSYLVALCYKETFLFWGILLEFVMVASKDIFPPFLSGSLGLSFPLIRSQTRCWSRCLRRHAGSPIRGLGCLGWCMDYLIAPKNL